MGSWTRAKVIATLKRLRAEHRALAYDRVPLYILTAAAEQFGTYQAALAAAGVGTPVAKTKSRAGQRQVWTREAVISGIRKVARDGGLISANPGMSAAAKRYFGSVAEAAKAANVTYASRRKWTREEVIRELQTVARRDGCVTHTTVAELRMRSAIVKHFGGIVEACEAAGVVGYDQRLRRVHELHDDPRTVLRKFRAVAAELDHPVREADLTRTLAAAARRHFGSIGAARNAAKLPHPAPIRRWTRSSIVADLRREHTKRTRLTIQGLIDARRWDLVAAIQKQIGSIARARRLAGLPDPRRPPRRFAPFVRVWDADRVIEEIRKRARSQQPLAFSRVPSRLASAARLYLGSWRAAVEAAGFDYHAVAIHKRFDNDELFAQLRNIAKRHPTMTLNDLHLQPIAKTLVKRFGSLEAAAHAAGLVRWPIRLRSGVRSRQELQRLLRARVRAGKSLEQQELLVDVPDLRASLDRIHPVWNEALQRLGFANRVSGTAPSVRHRKR